MKQFYKYFDKMKEGIKQSSYTSLAFLRWIIIGITVGVIVGLCGTGFYFAFSYVTNLRNTYSWLLYLLPLSGIIIAFLNKAVHMDKRCDTNMVLESIRTDEDLPFKMAPMIFITTILTHLCGGSAGREGAALQLGGSIATKIGQIFKLSRKDMHTIVMCGMSACFAAVFGTPAAAAIFSIEVVSVGIMHYSALVPCTIASVIGSSIAKAFGANGEHFFVPAVPSLSILSMGKVVVLAVLCAALSVLFCKSMKGMGYLYRKYIPNSYLKIASGGAIIVVLTFLFGRDYLGAGTNLILKAMSEGVSPESFAVKILFTAVTLQAGYKGGEIVPSLTIGALFGYTIGSVLGMPLPFAAALGMITMFCGVTNCPVTSFILGLEMFGAKGVAFYLVSAAVGYMMSGYTGLYKKQKIMYSKTENVFIDKMANSRE